jgi:hypothetical protein
MSSKTTVRATLSTCVRAVANITPKLSSFAPFGWIASAERNSMRLPTQLLTCGWYIITVAFVRLTWRGHGSAGSCDALAGAAAGAACADAAVGSTLTAALISNAHSVEVEIFMVAGFPLNAGWGRYFDTAACVNMKPA